MKKQQKYLTEKQEKEGDKKHENINRKEGGGAQIDVVVGNALQDI